MPVDTAQILAEAEKLGQLLKDHPAVERFKSAQKSVADDPEAGRLLAEFDKHLESLGRQEQQGRPVTDAQRMQLESLQAKIISHIKIKNLNLAQVEFVDLLRKISQTYQRPLADGALPGQGAARPGAITA
ncbi:MAG: YlbF family regulator [Planctomycetota bacterium]|nr:YlbF family regulator [Planctomycetota bacterium]